MKTEKLMMRDEERKTTAGGLRTALLLALLLCLGYSGRSEARITEPYVTIYGTARDRGVALTEGTVTVVLNADTAAVASGAVGADHMFSLRIPMDSVDPRTPDTAREEDSAGIYVNGILSGRLLMPERGTFLRLDADTDFSNDANHNGLPDLWERLFPGDNGRGDMNGNGISDLQEWLEGRDPASCVWNVVDTLQSETCVFDPRVLQHCLTDAADDRRGNLIKLVSGRYQGNFHYTAVWGENFGLTMLGGYNHNCTARTTDPSLTILDGDNKGTVLLLDTVSGLTTGLMHLEGLTLRGGLAPAGLQGGGLRALCAEGTLEITGNIITANTADAGGGVYVQLSAGTAELTNNMIYKNSATVGGGVALAAAGGRAAVVNNTLVGNTAATSAGGLQISIADPASSVDVVNNIIYGNVSGAGRADLAVTGSGIMQVLNNDLGDSSGIPATAVAAGNISADPLFAGAAVDNYHLAPASPCYNAGHGSYARLPLTDFEGGSRDPDYPDIGADEHGEYLLVVAVNEYGSAVSSPPGIIGCMDNLCRHWFTAGAAVTLLAEPLPGSVLYSFTGCDTLNGLSCTVAMNRARDVSVLFHDVTAPAAVLSTTAPEPVVSTPIPVTITFSEYVNGFGLGSLSVTNGVAGNLAELVPGRVWTADITPVADGPALVSVALPAGMVNDNSGNGNTAAAVLSRHFSNSAPTVVISSGAPDPTGLSPIPVTISFSEAVNGFSLGSLAVTNGTAANLVPLVAGRTWTAEITPTGGSGSVVTVGVPAGAVTDLLGNGNLAAVSLSREYNTLLPLTTVSSGAANPTGISPIPVTISFSREVSGFTLDDIKVTNGAAGGFSFSGGVYRVAIVPSKTGLVTVEVPAGAAQDSSGNKTTAAEYSINFDNTPPVSVITSPKANAAAIASALTITGTALDTGSKVSRVEVSINGGPWLTAVGTTSWHYTVTGLLSGQVNVRSRAADTAGNLETPGQGVTATIYIRQPSAVVVDRSVPGAPVLSVDGRPFTVKGVVYTPVPVGDTPEAGPSYGDYFTAAYSGIYNRDLPYLRQLNANAVRLVLWNNTANHLDFLDKAYNGGLYPVYVIAGFMIDPGSDIDPLSAGNVREKIKADFREMVGMHKDHPAILLWAIGNQLNTPGMYGGSVQDALSLADEMAAEAHAEEGAHFHPVLAELADHDLASTLSLYDSTLPALDIWGASVFFRGRSFGTLFDSFAAASGRPLLVTGYGLDAYNNISRDEYQNTGLDYQADYAAALWGELASTHPSIGGCYMEYSDEWWAGEHASDKACPRDVDPHYHGTCGDVDSSSPDGYLNYEWRGLMRIAANAPQPDRVSKRAVFGVLQDLFWSSADAVKINGVSEFTRTTAVGLQFAARTTTAQVCVSNNSSCSAWSAYTPAMNWTLSSGDGLKTVYVWFRESNGTVNAAAHTDTITLDTTPPQDGTLVPTPGNGSVALAWQGFTDALSGIAGYKLVYSLSGLPQNCSSGTSLYSGSDDSLVHSGLANGTKYSYRLCAYDRAGNLSAGATVSSVPVVEQNPPVGSVVINNGADVTQLSAVTLTLTATDETAGLIQMCISNTTACAAWEAFAASKNWVLAGGDGLRTVYVWYRDVIGNATPVPYAAVIRRDSTPPSDGQLSAAAGNAKVELSWSGFADSFSVLSGYRLVYAPTAAPTSCLAGAGTLLYSGAATSFTHTGLVNGSSYYYRLCAYDRAGNSSAGAVSSARPLPETLSPVGEVIINGGAALTKSPEVLLALSATDASGVAQMCISNSRSCSAWETYTTSKLWMLSNGDGPKTVYVWFRDVWGNTSAAPYSGLVTLDTTAPDGGVVGVSGWDRSVLLSWEGFGDALTGIGGYKLVQSTLSVPQNCYAGNTIGIFLDRVTSFKQGGLSNGTTYYFRVCAIDMLGNMSAGVSATATPEVCGNKPVRLSGTGGGDFDLLQSAIASAVSGARVSVHAGIYVENLLISEPKTLRLTGGFNCTFGSNSHQHSRLQGQLVIGGGPVIIENIVIE